MQWQIGRIPKDKLPVLNGSVLLGEGASMGSGPRPVRDPPCRVARAAHIRTCHVAGRSVKGLSLSLFVHFKVKEYSASGLKVASLRVENEEHQPYKGVRSITRAGSFEVRC